MKIALPNAEEYLHREELFFDQLELSVYHARKAWDKIKKQDRYRDPEAVENGDYPWIKYGFDADIEIAVDKCDPDYKSREITILIEEI